MKKPIIVLADTDENYLAPLEEKFIDETGDHIDLEIITDPLFFNEYFSQPQKIDILVISEDLYRTDLHRLNIRYIFLLTEEPDEGGTDDLRCHSIYKYTSTKEIYHRIVSVAAELLESEFDKPTETEVVLVYSPLGGVGKTTVALGLSACLAQSHKRVLYINAERLSTFQYRLNNRAELPADLWSELAAGGDDLFNKIAPAVRKEKFDYLPPAGAALSALNMHYSVYEKLIRSAKASGRYDFIIVDTDAVFDSAKASLMLHADKVMMLTDQTARGVFAMNVLLKNVNGSDEEKYIFLCNHYDPEKPNALLGEPFKPDFVINDYIADMKDIDRLSAINLGQKVDIQKLAFLLI